MIFSLFSARFFLIDLTARNHPSAIVANEDHSSVGLDKFRLTSKTTQWLMSQPQTTIFPLYANLAANLHLIPQLHQH